MNIVNIFQYRFNEKKYFKFRYKLQSTSNKFLKYILLIYLRRVENSMNCNTGLGLGTSDSPCCFIGKCLRIPHRLNNIIIARNVKIGNNVTLYHSVTIAEEDKNKVTTTGNNVVIGAGTVILNNVRIGNGAVIGANSVVTKDVKYNEVVAGNPAKVIKKVNKK